MTSSSKDNKSGSNPPVGPLIELMREEKLRKHMPKDIKMLPDLYKDATSKKMKEININGEQVKNSINKLLNEIFFKAMGDSEQEVLCIETYELVSKISQFLGAYSPTVSGTLGGSVGNKPNLKKISAIAFVSEQLNRISQVDQINDIDQLKNELLGIMNAARFIAGGGRHMTDSFFNAIDDVLKVTFTSKGSREMDASKIVIRDKNNALIIWANSEKDIIKRLNAEKDHQSKNTHQAKEEVVQVKKAEIPSSKFFENKAVLIKADSNEIKLHPQKIVDLKQVFANFLIPIYEDQKDKKDQKDQKEKDIPVFLYPDVSQCIKEIVEKEIELSKKEIQLFEKYIYSSEKDIKKDDQQKENVTTSWVIFDLNKTILEYKEKITKIQELIEEKRKIALKWEFLCNIYKMISSGFTPKELIEVIERFVGDPNFSIDADKKAEILNKKNQLTLDDLITIVNMVIKEKSITQIINIPDAIFDFYVVQQAIKGSPESDYQEFNFKDIIRKAYENDANKKLIDEWKSRILKQVLFYSDQPEKTGLYKVDTKSAMEAVGINDTLYVNNLCTKLSNITQDAIKDVLWNNKNKQDQYNELCDLIEKVGLFLGFYNPKLREKSVNYEKLAAIAFLSKQLNIICEARDIKNPETLTRQLVVAINAARYIAEKGKKIGGFYNQIDDLLKVNKQRNLVRIPEDQIIISHNGVQIDWRREGDELIANLKSKYPFSLCKGPGPS